MKKITSILLVFAIALSCFAYVGCDLWNQIVNPTSTTRNTIKPSSTTAITTTTTTKTTTTTTTTTTISSTTSTTATTSKPNYDDIVWEEKIYSNTTIDDNFVPGEVIVVLDKAISEVNKVHSAGFFVGVNILSIEDLTSFSNPDVIVDKENFNQVLLLTLFEKTKEAVIDAIKIIEKIEGVKYAGANNIDEPDAVFPDDPYYSYIDDERDQWALDAIDAPMVWGFSTGSNCVRIGVIDTGVASHIDLDNTDNGNYIFDNSLDFYRSSTDDPLLGKTDLNSHGTHVAGIIGAIGNNNEGVSGVNWSVSIVQMRVGVHGFDSASVVKAIKWAADVWDTPQRISILSYSSGVYEPRPEYESVIREYCEKGGLFICSTGNKPQDNDLEGQHHYPSFYASELYSNPIDNMITVGRSDINDERPNGANWGDETIMLYAPGQNIVSTIPLAQCRENCASSNHIGYGYHLMSGSSMATPYVSGVAALLLSIDPQLTASQLRRLY